jgi:hypothetical protein
MRSAHEKPDGLWMGLNVYTGEPIDMMKEGVIEPLSVKVQAIKSAVEASSMILRIDDVIAAGAIDATVRRISGPRLQPVAGQAYENGEAGQVGTAACGRHRVRDRDLPAILE